MGLQYDYFVAADDAAAIAAFSAPEGLPAPSLFTEEVRFDDLGEIEHILTGRAIAEIAADPRHAADLADRADEDTGLWEVSLSTKEFLHELVETGCPDIVILDVRLGPGNQLDDNLTVLESLEARTLVVTCDPDRSEIPVALRHRQISILDKDDLAERLHDALRLTMAGTVVIAPSIQARLQTQTLKAPELTARQREVFALLATGLPVKVVARRLNIGYKIAHDHVEEIRRKFREAGPPREDELKVHYAAIRFGYIPDPRDGE